MLNKSIRQVVVFLVSALMLWSCTETKELQPDFLGANYFPLSIGEYRVYNVNELQYYSVNDIDTFSYQLKETVVDSFPNLEGGISYKIRRERMSADESTWMLESIWTARKDDYSAIYVENNIPLVKLTFPLAENKIWDGNKYSVADKDEFEMINVGKEYSTEFDNFGNTVTVVQEDLPDSIIQQISRKEIYAKGVGMIEKENINIYFVQGDDAQNGEINSGIKYFQLLIEHGKEE